MWVYSIFFCDFGVTVMYDNFPPKMIIFRLKYDNLTLCTWQCCYGLWVLLQEYRFNVCSSIQEPSIKNELLTYVFRLTKVLINVFWMLIQTSLHKSNLEWHLKYYMYTKTFKSWTAVQFCKSSVIYKILHLFWWSVRMM